MCDIHASRKKMSDRVLMEIRKQFFSKQRKHGGLLSWGELTKMLRETELKLCNDSMNRLYQVPLYQAHDKLQNLISKFALLYRRSAVFREMIFTIFTV